LCEKSQEKCPGRRDAVIRGGPQTVSIGLAGVFVTFFIGVSARRVRMATRNGEFVLAIGPVASDVRRT
jgi:hypothetical protein